MILPANMLPICYYNNLLLLYDFYPSLAKTVNDSKISAKSSYNMNEQEQNLYYIMILWLLISKYNNRWLESMTF